MSLALMRTFVSLIRKLNDILFRVKKHKNRNNVPPEFQVAKKLKVEHYTESDIVTTRAHIRFTLLEKYKGSKIGSNDTFL